MCLNLKGLKLSIYLLNHIASFGGNNIRAIALGGNSSNHTCGSLKMRLKRD
jgi:hypothetical protein